MSQNMKTLLPNTKFYNFSRKFWQVTALSWTFFGATGRCKNFTGVGAAPLLPPLEPPVLTESPPPNGGVECTLGRRQSGF